MAEARALEFCTKGENIKSSQRDDKSPLKGAWFCSRDPFFLRNCGLRKSFATASCQLGSIDDGPLFVSRSTVNDGAAVH